MAATERGKKVLVKVGASSEVGDHDFTKFSLVSSVTLVNTIPSEISGSMVQRIGVLCFEGRGF